MVDITRISALNNLSSTTTGGTRATSSSSTTDSSSTSSATKKAEELQSQFLKILLTQMQNQNPTDPMDTKELTGQLAQFSTLEQQITTNAKLDQLISASGSNASTAAFGYIGQTAELSSPMTAIEDDTADWKYALASNADKLSIKVKDEQGRVVYEKTDTNVQSGTYSMTLNKSDMAYALDNGQVLTLSITATDQTGKSVSSEISTTVKVDGVESSSDGIDLRSGNLIYGLSDVKRFKSAATATTTGA